MSVGASVGNLMTATPSHQPVGHEAVQDAYKQQVADVRKEEELQKKLIKSQLDNALKKKIKDDKRRLVYEEELTAKSDKLSADILKQIEDEASRDFVPSGDMTEKMSKTDKALAKSRKIIDEMVARSSKPTPSKPHSSVGRLIEEKPTANPLAQPQRASSAEENPLLAVGTESLVAMGEEVIPMTIKTGIVAGGGGGAEEPFKLNPEQRQEMLQVGQELGLVGRKTPLFPEGFEAEEARGEAERAEQSKRFYEDNPAFF
jgi:hypothetical protein